MVDQRTKNLLVKTALQLSVEDTKPTASPLALWAVGANFEAGTDPLHQTDLIMTYLRPLLFCALFITSVALHAQAPRDYTVPLRASFDAASGSITLTWPKHADGKVYEIYRKGAMAANFPAEPLAVLDSTATSYVDTGLTQHAGYEYRILLLSRRFLRNDSVTKQPVYAQWYGTGYIVAGAKVIPNDRGRVLVLVDSTMTQPLADQIDRLLADLRNEGWNASSIAVPRAETFDGAKVLQVRNLIKDEHKEEPLSAILLIGRVPIPYSGNMAPDGHMPDHLGAWPADGIYGDINGVYNDATVNNNNTSRPVNANLPGDGKYDPSIFTTPLEIPVGRVDFFDMPAFTVSEIDLLKRYLDKNHAFRTNAWRVRSGGIIDDNFGTYGEVFAASAWRSFVVFGGDTAVRTGDFFGDLAGPTTYQFAYGCGGGTNTSAGGVGTTDDMAAKPVHAIFTLLFGSYFGDWNTRNNFLRASIATDPRALTCGWSGRPHWYLHHMAMGEPIGHSVRLSQNNQTVVNSALGNYIPNIMYTSQGSGIASAGDRGVHIALMGDPTLRAEMIPVPAVATATSSTEYPNKVNLSWTPPASPVDGYLVYRAKGNDTKFTRITPTPLTETTFQDSLRNEGPVRYRIVTLSLRSSASGTYYDMGPGVETSVTTTGVNDMAVRGAELNVSPNPTTGTATMTISTKESTPLRVHIHDLTGRTVWSFASDGVAPGTHAISWDGRTSTGDHVPGGRYVVRCTTNAGVTTSMVTVVR